MCYPEINRRKESVKEAHQKTFQWIYESNNSDTPTCQWDNFVQWLENGKGLYWISGKAGSGKSTLMNYIYQDDRTSRFLKVWSGSKEILTPNYFFWSAGTTLEKSLEGLLRSILYQIFQRFPSLIPLSCDNQSVIGPGKDGLLEHDPIVAWTSRRLQTVFQKVICQAQGMCCICIFIDGLDEISGDPDMVIAMIKEMHSTDVKVCLSSRPDRIYIDAFDSFAKLRLQDLTESDIRTYVWDKLQPFLDLEGTRPISRMLKDMVLKAQGVFLWVELVVKTLIAGLQNDDSLAQLQARVESTPSDIEALYAKMLDNIEGTYHQETVQLFQMVLAKLDSWLFHVAVALDDRFDCISGMSIRDALDSCRRAQKRIPIISGALLEIKVTSINRMRRLDWLPIGDNPSAEVYKLVKYERHIHVDFIHRTVYDFLRQSKQGQQFLDAYSPSCPSPRATYVRVLLVKVTLLRFTEKPENTDTVFESLSSDFIVLDTCDASVKDFFDFFVNWIMENVTLEECDTGRAQTSLCNDVDRSLAAVHQRYQLIPKHVHWSTQWGLSLSKFSMSRISAHEPLSGSASRSIFKNEPLPGNASRSSSSDSYNSAKSNFGFSFNSPEDFLGQAVSWTLSDYVIPIIDLQQRHFEKGYVDYLLCCSVLALFQLEDWNQDEQHHKEILKLLDLVAQLLSRGANPNVRIESYSTTVWVIFLNSHMWNKPFDGLAFANIMRTFLQHGADACVRVPSHVYVRAAHDKRRFERNMYVRYEWSVLNIIRRWQEDTPEWKGLEEMVLAKGACEFLKCTHIGPLLQSSQFPEYRWFKLSQRQRDKVMTALHVSYHGSERDSKISKHPVTMIWTIELEQVYQEISRKTEGSYFPRFLGEDHCSDIYETSDALSSVMRALERSLPSMTIDGGYLSCIKK